VKESRKESARERDRANAREGKGEGGKEGERGRDVRAAGREIMAVAWSKCGSLRAPTNPLVIFGDERRNYEHWSVCVCVCVCAMGGWV